MRYHHSLIHVNKILKALFKHFGRGGSDKIQVSVWSNGREQGYYIRREHLALLFAENRNSDSTMIITGHREDFDFQTHQPTEETYQKNKKYFESDQDEKAVDHIIQFLERTG